MPDAKILNATRAAFMRRASAPDINPFALKLAYLIAFKHMDSETGTTFVSQATLARDLNVEERHVRRMLTILQRLGLVIAPGHGHGRANTYWIDPGMATPDSPASGSKRSTRSGYNRSTRSGLKSQPDSTIQPTGLSTTAKRSPESALLKKTPRKLQGRENIYPAPDVASRDAGQDEQQVAAAFAEFWAVYPLKVGKLDAEKAYLKAKAGTPTAVMNAGAARYAAERVGQDAKFTKHPARWIKGECWSDEPSSTGPPTIDQDGNVIAEADPEQSVDDYLTQLIGPHKNWYGT